MPTSDKPGFYIVTLNNENYISVNAQDKEKAQACIKVNKLNFKYGKSKNLDHREKNYKKTFGPNNINFIPIALMEISDAKSFEDSVSAVLDEYRIRGQSNHTNEWVQNINLSNFLSEIISLLDYEKKQGLKCTVRKRAIKSYLEKINEEPLFYKLFPLNLD